MFSLKWRNVLFAKDDGKGNFLAVTCSKSGLIQVVHEGRKCYSRKGLVQVSNCILGVWNLLTYHRPSSTLLTLIGASAFAFNKYPRKPYIFRKLNSSMLSLKWRNVLFAKDDGKGNFLAVTCSKSGLIQVVHEGRKCYSRKGLVQVSNCILGVWNLLTYHRPSSTLLTLIGASAFAFNKYPRKPYIFRKLNSSRLLLIPFKKIKILTRFRNEKLFVKMGVTVDLSPGEPKINGRSQLRKIRFLTRLTKKQCVRFLSSAFAQSIIFSSTQRAFFKYTTRSDTGFGYLSRLW